MVTAKLKAVFQTAGGPPQAPSLDASERAFWIGLVTVVLSLVSGLATYLILTGLTPITPRDDVVLGALLTNIALIVAMIAILVWQGIGLWQAWRAEVPGARLHVRIVGLFSIIAALPAILLAVAATTTFSRAIDSWFTARARSIIDNSMEVAQSYLQEHGSVIRTDVANMARDIDAAADDIVDKPDALKQLLIAQAGLRDLASAYLVSPNGQMLLSAFDDAKETFVGPPLAAISEAEKGPDRDHQIAGARACRRSVSVAAVPWPIPARHARRQPKGDGLPPAHRAERRRIQPSAPRAWRPEARARADVHHDFDDGVARRHLGRPLVRRAFRGADTPPHRRRPRGLDAATSTSNCPNDEARATCAACRAPSTR